jgi:hypothetical protein
LAVPAPRFLPQDRSVPRKKAGFFPFYTKPLPHQANDAPLAGRRFFDNSLPKIRTYGSMGSGINEAIDKASHAAVAEGHKRLAHGETTRKQDGKNRLNRPQRIEKPRFRKTNGDITLDKPHPMM